MAELEIEKVTEETQEEAKLTKKQQEKREKEEKKYWNTMISRREAYQMVAQAIMREQEKFQLMYVQCRTIADLLIEKGIVTEEMLNEHSKKVIEELYEANPTPRSDYEKGQKEKEEGSGEQ